jgi:hypothetical protein
MFIYLWGGVVEKSRGGMKRFSGSIPASAIKNFLWSLADPRKKSNVHSSISAVNGFFYMFTAARLSFLIPVHPPPLMHLADRPS